MSCPLQLVCLVCIWTLGSFAVSAHQLASICVLWGCWVRTEQRSQAQNKAKALAILQAKLLVIAREQRAAEIKEIRGDMVKAEWGQQIRSYVFHPYKLVKDVRTAEETTDVQGVMDGDLDPFMQSFLRWKVASDAAVE